MGIVVDEFADKCGKGDHRLGVLLLRDEFHEFVSFEPGQGRVEPVVHLVVLAFGLG